MMQFGTEVDGALRAATALVNTLANGSDHLTEREQLDQLLDDQHFGGYRAGGAQELAEVRALRQPLRRVWRAGKPAVVAELANRLLRQAQALPQLVQHGESDWHLHVTPDEAALVDRLAAQSAIGFITLVRAEELARLKHCAAPACDAVLIDFSRNRSRRFCDTGNCGNRQHVAAYRARKLSTVTR